MNTADVMQGFLAKACLRDDSFVLTSFLLCPDEKNRHETYADTGIIVSLSVSLICAVLLHYG